MSFSHVLPYVLSRSQMQAVDRTAVDHLGVPSLLLMENAGRGVAEAILRRAVRPVGRPLAVAVVCGAGNNGGDGSVVARHLALDGADVRVLLAVPPAKVGGDAAVMLRALAGVAGVSVVDLSDVASVSGWQVPLEGADVLVDAVFGTGLRSEVTGTAGAAIGAMNAASGLKVAVDIPSGLDADHGRPHGVAFRPHVTLTTGARKLGLVIDADAPVGELEVVGLGVPIEPPGDLAPFCFWLEQAAVQAALPRRQGSAFKGSGGHLVVVAGSAGKTGAALLTARAALRTGAGLVTVASTAAGRGALDAKVLEEMTAAYAPGDDADGGSYDAIVELCQRPHVRAMALGPGIPVGPGMRALVERVARELPIPLVIDADGLNLLGDRASSILAAAGAPRIVTPHPGEMARMCGRTTSEIQGDRLEVARTFAVSSHAVVVLKGARTLVSAPDGSVFVSPFVEPALATAGSGDVLTGVVGALLAQGMDPLAAAWAGVYLHGAAGARAARDHGVPGVIAGDLPETVAAVRASWSSDPVARR